MADTKDTIRDFVQAELPPTGQEEKAINIVSAPDGSIMQTGVTTSKNYVKGVSGWKLTAEGEFEYNVVFAPKIGTTSRANAAGTGSQVITHNLGKAPNLIEIEAIQDTGTDGSICIGKAISVATQQSVCHGAGSSGATVRATATAIIAMADPGGADLGTASISAIDINTFTLNWTTAASASGAITFNWKVSYNQ